MIFDYLIKFHLQDCINILSELDNLGHYSIKIDFMKLFETYPDVGDKVLCSPVESLPIINNDILKAQRTILENEEYANLISELRYKFLKRNVKARFFGLPVCPELHRTIFPKNVDMGCFLKVSGTVVRVTQTKMLEYQRKYVCMKCKFENCVEADFENRYILKAPSKCGNNETRCRCSTFTQEQVNKLSIGTIPGSMWVVLEDDLVDCCKPGDDVNICMYAKMYGCRSDRSVPEPHQMKTCNLYLSISDRHLSHHGSFSFSGTVRRRWRPSVQNKKSEVELVMHANYIEVSNAQRSEVIASAPDIKDCFNDFWNKFEACPLKGRDQIIASVCPQVYGLHLVKLAVILTVITGSNHVIDDDSNELVKDDKYAMHVRGQCHLLLVGDPGTGKSQLLRAGAELTPRSVFTSGAGSMRAGLTSAALRLLICMQEDGEWQLEAGALVLSDGGVCCIDEISHLREHDRAAIHEAMEQQTISIAKAGIVCKLNTRCAVIAACNPKGHYQTDEPLSANVSLGTPLLSRFDLIFILLDSKNKSWDKLVSSYILHGAANAKQSKTKWTVEKLQMYIGLVGPRHTGMTKSANTILQSYYMLQRKSQNRDPSRTTVRMLDSLVRLSQAHCRLMYRTTILPVDAIMAVSLVDLSMQDCTLSDTMDALHSTLQKYPDFDYLCTAKTVLERLHLLEIWKEELLYYAKLFQTDYKTLETDIEDRNTKLFSKYDNVADDNIPLSCSLITSSYFNKNEKKSDDNDCKSLNKENACDIEKQIVINDRLAATLKKHATLNKGEDKIPNVRKKFSRKRKRKEITADVSTVGVKNKPKFCKKDKTNLSSDSDGSLGDTTAILNAVPSVNDIDIDLNIVKDSSIKENVEIEEAFKCNSDKKKDDGNFNKELQAKKEDRPVSKTISFLKQFQYVKKEDSNKTDRNVKESDVVLLSSVKREPNEIGNKNLNKATSSGSSQISIFESSDCDIDLDI